LIKDPYNTYRLHLEEAGPEFLQGLIGQIKRRILAHQAQRGYGPPAPSPSFAMINMGNTAARAAAMKARMNEPIGLVSLVRITDLTMTIDCYFSTTND